MDVTEAIRRRRMTRSFESRPIDPEVLDEILMTSLLAPSAGNSRGTSWISLVGELETAQAGKSVLRVELYADEAAPQLPRDGGARPRAEEGVENQVSGGGGGEDQFCHELLGLLRRVARVFRHGPEGHGEIGPEIGGGGVAEAPLFPLGPVLRLSLRVPVGCPHAAPQPHRPGVGELDAVAEDVHETEHPDPELIRILRDECDPDGIYLKK